MRVELPEAQWAEIADVSELRNGDRKAVNKAIFLHVDENKRPVISGDLEDEMLGALYRRVIRSWSLPFPIPADDPLSVDKLTIAVADALGEAVAPHLALCRGKEDPTDKKSDPTEGSVS